MPWIYGFREQGSVKWVCWKDREKAWAVQYSEHWATLLVGQGAALCAGFNAHCTLRLNIPVHFIKDLNCLNGINIKLSAKTSLAASAEQHPDAETSELCISSTL